MKRVFLSFRAEDKDHVQGVRLLALSPIYRDLEFYDESVQAPFNSFSVDYIKQQIRQKISRTTVTVVLISEQTYTSDWVNWELQESDAKGNTIIAMAIKGVTQAILPPVVKQKGLTFHSWDPEALGKMIEGAS